MGIAGEIHDGVSLREIPHNHGSAGAIAFDNKARLGADRRIGVRSAKIQADGGVSICRLGKTIFPTVLARTAAVI